MGCDDDKLNKALIAASQKQFAFVGVAVSTIATLTAIIAVPMLCMHMHTVHSGIQEELAFCRTKTTGLQAEFVKVIHFLPFFEMRHYFQSKSELFSGFLSLSFDCSIYGTLPYATLGHIYQPLTAF